MALYGRVVCCIKFRFYRIFPRCPPHDNGRFAQLACCYVERQNSQTKVHRSNHMRLYGRGITCVRGGREVFAGLDFEVAAGAALAITGANGAGKSSLLRILAGLLPQASGSIGFEGRDEDSPLAEQVHYLGHRDPIKGALTVRENLAFWQEFLGGAPTLITKSLDAVGLAYIADLPAAYLSAGQKRRLSIARLLAVKRPIWLLDEPASTLDVQAQTFFTAIMSAHLADGGLIVAAAHGPLGVAAQELRIGGKA